MIRMRKALISLVAALLAGASASAAETPLASVSQVAAGLSAPPDDTRPMMRWWWFGPSVQRGELQREIRAMKAGGIGGFEIQPVYPQALDDAASGLRNLPYLSDEFIAMLRYAGEQGRAEGLRVDLTLGSGWPFGGPSVPVNEAAAQLRVKPLDLPAGQTAVSVPELAAGEVLLAAWLQPDASAKPDPATLQALPLPKDGKLQVTAKNAGRRVIFFIQSRTGQMVKRASVGSEGFVLDHLSQQGVAHYLHNVGDRLLQAFPDQPPYAVFSDSLEVYGADWTPGLLEEFQRRRGYDLKPLLPQLVFDGPQSGDVRHDWGLTLAELVDDHYLKPVNAWAQQRGTRFRSQTYGFPPVTLSSNDLVALPEGEGVEWREFSSTRWATSAAHLYGRPVISAESFTWLHSPAFRATPLDVKAEADILFLQGINQIIGHGWPYTPPGQPQPGWSLYAAGVFSDQNPWWIVMPDLSRYLQRASYVLRQGAPANDVAIYVPTHDALAETKNKAASITQPFLQGRYITPVLTTQLLDAGYGFDYIDDAAIQRLGIRHPVLLLPHVERIDPETYRRIEVYAQAGGIVLALGSQPALGMGLQGAAEQKAQVQAISKRLFTGSPRVKQLEDAQLGHTLRALLPPDFQPQTHAEALGFVHRKLADGDVYFIANTTAKEVDTTLKVHAGQSAAQWWDLRSGERSNAGAGPYALKLAPYESRVLVLGTAAASASATVKPAASPQLIADLSHDWQIEFAPLKIKRETKNLVSWTDDAATRFYSGEAVYTREVKLDRSALKAGTQFLLDFGPGTPVGPDPKQRGHRAWLESPVREAAVVFVNGERAGSVWMPPYRLDISRWLRPGSNRIELRVANLGTNAMAGRPRTDYSALKAQYGDRFQPQDQDRVKAEPSGVLGPVHLLAIKGS